MIKKNSEILLEINNIDISHPYDPSKQSYLKNSCKKVICDTFQYLDSLGLEEVNDWKKLSFANSLSDFQREQFSICLSHLKNIFLNENETSLEVNIKEKASQISWDEIKINLPK